MYSEENAGNYLLQQLGFGQQFSGVRAAFDKYNGWITYQHVWTW
jgi:hypothetical protein